MIVGLSPKFPVGAMVFLLEMSQTRILGEIDGYHVLTEVQHDQCKMWYKTVRSSNEKEQ